MSTPRLILPDAEALRAMAAQRSAATGGWQRHHLLPRALAHHRQIARWLAEMGGLGPALKEREANILWLPATEALAATTGMALHRGPHPAYTAVVAERLERIRCAATSPKEARGRVARLQRALARTLTGSSGPTLHLNRHDPMRLFADYGTLDDAIARLLADQQR